MSGTLGHSGGARPGRAGRHATRFILEIGDEVDVMVGEIKTKARVLSVKPQLILESEHLKFIVSKCEVDK